MYALNTGKTRDPVLAACAREVALLASLGQHRITFVHIPGILLAYVDALSRQFHNKKSKTLASQISQKLRPNFLKPIPLLYTFSPI